MAAAKKCDICGKLYEEYSTRFDERDVNGFEMVYIDEDGEFGGGVPTALDCCPECMESIKNHIECLREKSSKEERFICVVIHRLAKKDMEIAYDAVRKIILKDLVPSYYGDHVVKFASSRAIIQIGNIYFHFRCGDPYKMAGILPDYYNINSTIASDLLHQAASKVGGKELKSLSELIETIKSLL